MKEMYDIVIVGGGTSGVSCAWNAAKLGLKVLIIEKNSFLGGAITSSLVIPAMKTSENSINNDFFNALYDKLQEMDGAITYSDGNKGWYNPELTKIALDILMAEMGIDIIYEAQVKDFKIKNQEILSLSIETIDNDNIFSDNNKMLLIPIVSRYFVDSTGDANFCQKLNCEFLNKNDLKNEFQPTSLRFIMSGVNVKEFSEWLLNFDKNRDVTSACEIDGRIYLSTAYTWDENSDWALKPLFERAIADGVLTKKDTNYFQIFSVAGTSESIAFNAPRLIDDIKNRSEAYREGRLSIFRLANFCKKYLVGFKNAYISSIASSLGVRVSARVRGNYIYTYEDLISGKKFKTPVLVSNYPVDIHSTQKNNSTLQKVEQEYQLPIDSLQVKGYNNLFVLGRCISADFKAQAALRIIPSCFSMGEGLAKWLASNKN